MDFISINFGFYFDITTSDGALCGFICCVVPYETGVSGANMFIALTVANCSKCQREGETANHGGNRKKPTELF